MNYNPFRPKKLNQLPTDIQNHIISFHPMVNTINVSFEFREDLILFIGDNYILVTFESNASFRLFFPDEYNYLKNLILTNNGYSGIKDHRYYALNLNWFPQIDPQLGFKYTDNNPRNEFSKQATYFDLFDFYQPYIHMRNLYDQPTYLNYVGFKILCEVKDHYDMDFEDIRLKDYLYELVNTYITHIDIGEVHGILHHLRENQPDDYKFIMRTVDSKDHPLSNSEWAACVFNHDFWVKAKDYIENMDPVLLDRYNAYIWRDVSSVFNTTETDRECMSLFRLTNLGGTSYTYSD